MLTYHRIGLLVLLLLSGGCGELYVRKSLANAKAEANDSSDKATPLEVEALPPRIPVAEAGPGPIAAPPPVVFAPIVEPMPMPVPIPEPLSFGAPPPPFGMPVPVPVPLAIADRHHDHEKEICCEKACALANAGFFSISEVERYIIPVPLYPLTTPLSKNRNFGLTEGDILLTSTGLRINEPGNYWVSFSATLINNNETYNPELSIFLVKNGIFVPGDTDDQFAVTGGFYYDIATTLTGSGNLFDVTKGTTLSIVASNAHSPDTEDITVVLWSINIHKICDNNKCIPKDKEEEDDWN